MPYRSESAGIRVSPDAVFAPNINSLYDPFEANEDQLRLDVFNKRLAEQSGEEFHVDFYYGHQVKMLDTDTLSAIAECYKKVFNESWNENWTTKSAIHEIITSFQESIERTPVLSLLYKGEEVIGFCMAYIIDNDNFSESSLAFSSSKLKRHESIEVAKYWVNSVSKNNKFAIIRELGVLKEYRQDKALFLCLPVLEKSYNIGCKVIFFRTKMTSKVFKLSLGVGFFPLQFFIVDDLLLMQGNLKYAVNLLDGMLSKNRKKSWGVFFTNIKRYLCE